MYKVYYIEGNLFRIKSFDNVSDALLFAETVKDMLVELKKI